jgi:hypothetical protein
MIDSIFCLLGSEFSFELTVYAWVFSQVITIKNRAKTEQVSLAPSHLYQPPIG